MTVSVKDIGFVGKSNGTNGNHAKNKSFIKSPDFNQGVDRAIALSRLDRMVNSDEYDFEGYDKEIAVCLENEFNLKKKPPRVVNIEKQCRDNLGVLWAEIGIARGEARFDKEADLVVEQWLANSDIFSRIFRGNFDSDGDFTRAKHLMIGDRSAQEQFGYLFFYKDKPHFLHLYFYERDQEWIVRIWGGLSGDFLEKLQGHVDLYVIRKYKGKMINGAMEDIELKIYSYSDLIYPPKLVPKIEKMITSFQGWLHGNKVDQWGQMVIGKPGTGKTTIGGLLAGMRGDATFLYCPAAEIGNSDLLNAVFEKARLLAPTILQIDDVDLISGSRADGSKKALTSALMENLDGLEKSGKLFLILTTNDPTGMDQAIANRAGRICNKIVFEGYGDCMTELLQRFSANYKLQIEPAMIEEAVMVNREKVNVFTPDEAKNVCQRLTLLGGDSHVVALEELNDAILATFEAFHDESHMKSFLAPKKKTTRKSSKK